jgi:hypothetical protein
MGSQLLTVQKIDALKTFLLPSLDFQLLNGDIGARRLKTLDQGIRAAVDKELIIRGLPVQCHHASWRDGGLSYPSLKSREQVLKVRSFVQMMTSKDENIRRVMHQFAEDERLLRHIDEDPAARFLNWKIMERESWGTASIVGRARKACQELDILLKVEGATGMKASALKGAGQAKQYLRRSVSAAS